MICSVGGSAFLNHLASSICLQNMRIVGLFIIWLKEAEKWDFLGSVLSLTAVRCSSIESLASFRPFFKSLSALQQNRVVLKVQGHLCTCSRALLTAKAPVETRYLMFKNKTKKHNQKEHPKLSLKALLFHSHTKLSW